jgi:thioredoxin-dependent peroxiredoxin
MIPEGSEAPDFESPSTGGTFRLRDAIEAGPLVLFFYPQASTPGCTNEAVEFEAWYDRFEEIGVRIAGCSVDTLDDQKAFSAKHGGFRYPLIADSSADIGKAYGVYREDWKLTGRATAVIGEDGTVIKTYPKAPLHGKGHAEEVFADVRGLSS